jgi:hypothetical protein
MYCNGCGTQLTAGAQFCTKCGKAVIGGGVTGTGGAYAGHTTSTVRVSEGRVRRHLNVLVVLWAINGILRLVSAGIMLIFGTVFLPFLRGGRGFGWPIGGGWGIDSFWGRTVLSVGMALAVFGVLYLALAWGLRERESWARMLGVVMGFVALVRFPPGLGTALGVYTLWVLLPEESAAEYNQISGNRMNSSAVSS